MPYFVIGVGQTNRYLFASEFMIVFEISNRWPRYIQNIDLAVYSRPQTKLNILDFVKFLFHSHVQNNVQVLSLICGQHLFFKTPRAVFILIVIQSIFLKMYVFVI